MTGTSVRETLRTPITQRAQDRFLGSVMYERLKSAGQMGALAVRIPVLALRPPYPWWRDALTEAATGVRRSFVPLMLSDAVFLISFVIIIFGNVLTNLGVSERES